MVRGRAGPVSLPVGVLPRLSLGFASQLNEKYRFYSAGGCGDQGDWRKLFFMLEVLTGPPEPQPEAHLRYSVVFSQYSKVQVGSLAERVIEEAPQRKANFNSVGWDIKIG